MDESFFNTNETVPFFKKILKETFYKKKVQENKLCVKGKKESPGSSFIIG